MTSSDWFPYEQVPQQSRRQRRRNPWVATGLVAALFAVAGLSGLLYYSNESARGWKLQSDRTSAALASMTAERDATAKSLADAQSSLSSTRVELDSMTNKYNEATKRIRSLANEKAQEGDRAEFLAQVNQLASQVSAELDSCVSDLQELQVYLVNFMSYDPDSLAQFAAEVNRGCNQARSDNAALSDLLSQ